MASLSHWLRTFGCDLKRLRNAIHGIRRYQQNRSAFKNQLGAEFAWGKELPVLDEWSASSGHLGAYFHQDLLIARWIYEASPKRHVDIGSRIDGFIGHLAVFRKVDVIDIRPQPSKIPNVVFHQLNLMDELPAHWNGCTDSLSCLHTIEHFGLGRYGDPIDPYGHLRGLRQLMAMVRPGGVLYLSTPIGPQRIEFNAHRVFSMQNVLGWFVDGWDIERFAILDDNETVHEPAVIDSIAASNNFGCYIGLAMIAARKRNEI